MESLEATITIRRNGVVIQNIARRIEVDELQAFNYEKAADNDAVTFSALPADQIANIQFLLARTNKAITIRLDGQTDAGIVLNAGGLLLIVDATIDAGAGASNAKINNPAASDIALVEGLAAGT